MSSPYKSAKIIMAYETAEDLRVECPEVDLVMFRAYSSGSAHEGPLGYGWTHSYEWHAERAAEIASAGGYAAWVAQRASDPNRRLVGLNIALQGGRWPVYVDVGIVPVMADGNAELLYAIDCGAQVPFSLSDGELDECAIVELCNYGNEALGIGGEAQFHNATFTHLHNFTIPQSSNCAFPYECMIGDVTVHLDSPRTGWLRRIAEVSVDALNLTHLYPGSSAHLTAVVTNCHADAYLGCAWHGGEGISFSSPQSLVYVALDQCNVLCYTNSFMAMKGLVLNPNGVHRDKALEIMVKFGPLNDEMTQFIESIATNVTAYTWFERGTSLFEYEKRLCSYAVTNATTANAVQMFKRLKHYDAFSAVPCDIVFCQRIEGWTMSSNRLEYALWALCNEHLQSNWARRFTSVTNQLLSSGQPLVQLDIGEGE